MDLDDDLYLENQNRAKFETLKAKAGIVVELKEDLFSCSKERFEHFYNLPLWTIEEGIFLILGRDPEHGNIELMKKSRDISIYSNLYNSFKEIYECICNDTDARKLPLPKKNPEKSKTTPEQFVSWAIHKGYKIPDALYEIWYKNCMEQNLRFAAESEKRAKKHSINGSNNIQEYNDYFISFEQLQERWAKKGIKALLPEQALNHANKGRFGVYIKEPLKKALGLLYIKDEINKSLVDWLGQKAQSKAIQELLENHSGETNIFIEKCIRGYFTDFLSLTHLKGYELLLISDLPQSGPKERVIYLGKQDDHQLKYLVINPEGEQISDLLNIAVSELTEKYLFQHKDSIVDEISKRGHINSIVGSPVVLNVFTKYYTKQPETVFHKFKVEFEQNLNGLINAIKDCKQRPNELAGWIIRINYQIQKNRDSLEKLDRFIEEHPFLLKKYHGYERLATFKEVEIERNCKAWSIGNWIGEKEKPTSFSLFGFFRGEDNTRDSHMIISNRYGISKLGLTENLYFNIEQITKFEATEEFQEWVDRIVNPAKKEAEEANRLDQEYKLLSDKNQNTMIMFDNDQKNLIEQPKQKTASEMGKKGAQKTHTRTVEAKEVVKKIAEDLIARKEATEEVRTTGIVEEIFPLLKDKITNNGKPYAKSTIKTWLRGMNILPEKMKKSGRPPRKPKIFKK